MLYDTAKEGGHPCFPRTTQPVSGVNHDDRRTYRDWGLLVSCLSLFLLLSGGRLGSSDAREQFRAAIVLVQTGQFGIDRELDPVLWNQAPNGWFYEVHDLGNTLLMLPWAVVHGWIAPAPAPASASLEPALPARVGAALMTSALAGLGVFWSIQWFAAAHRPQVQRTSWALGLIFGFGTLLGPYSKASWDVLGGCVMATGLIAASLKYTDTGTGTGRRHSGPRLRQAAWMGLLVAAAATFRYSAGPFLTLSAVWVVLATPGGRSWKHLLAFGLTLVLGLTPTFAYNALRSGFPWISGNMVERYQHALGWSGDPLSGLLGLLLSPNRGLLLFCPVLLLGIGLLFPRLRQRLSSGERRSCLAFGVGALGYLGMISGLKWWSTFGWGPRYLVPLLPAFYLPAALVLAHARGVERIFATLLVALSLMINLPPLLVNWSLISVDPLVIDAGNSSPTQILAVWQALLEGVGIREVSCPPLASASASTALESAFFPDLWTVRWMMAGSRVGRFAGGATSLILVVLILWGVRHSRAFRTVARQSQPADQRLESGPGVAESSRSAS